MASSGSTFITVDDSDVERMMDRIEAATSPVGLTAFLSNNVDPWLRRRASSRFRSEGDKATGKWAPLSPATVAIRESMGYGGTGPINRRTGDLEDYITSTDGDVTSSGSSTVTLTLPGGNPDGELAEKIMMAQTGVSKTGKQGTARPVLAMDEADLLYTLTTLSTYVKEGGR